MFFERLDQDYNTPMSLIEAGYHARFVLSNGRKALMAIGCTCIDSRLSERQITDIGKILVCLFDDSQGG